MSLYLTFHSQYNVSLFFFVFFLMYKAAAKNGPDTNYNCIYHDGLMQATVKSLLR